MPTKTKKQEEKKTSAQFFSKAVSLRVTLEPQIGPNDARRGVYGSKDETPGRHVEFVDHVFVTDDQKLIKELRDHPRFNVNFWEHGNAPDEPEPRLKAQLEGIKKGAREKDAAAVREVLDLEQQTHQRAPVISAAQAVLDALSDGKESASSASPSEN